MPEIKIRFLFIFLLGIILLNTELPGQEVPQPVANQGIYDFLDELAILHIIEINSAVKPFSRLLIAKKLKEADAKKEQLNSRQAKELEFYLLDFRKELNDNWLKGAEAQGHNDQNVQNIFTKASQLNGRRDLFFYRDSLFSLTINPILGGELFSNSSGRATYARNGGEARGYIGKWGFFASLRDNHEKPFLGLPQYLTQRVDGHIKEAYAWSEMQGGITYAWKWGSAGLVKDNLQWGNNYHGANIFGGNNPTFVQFRLHISPAKWFEFNYFHGWLNSEVVDSSQSYWTTNSYGTTYRAVFHKKFIAANMLTVTPVKNLHISAGNSIVYTYENVHPAYLIPVLFYKSVDHSLSDNIDNMNSQLFFDISSRQIKNIHLYATLFIDELRIARFKMDDQWNFFSWKTGFRLSNLPIDNLSLTTEFTYTYPLTFQHYVPTLTFQNAGYNLGYFLKDNSREIYTALDYHPARTMDICVYFLDEIRGPDYTELGTNRVGNPPIANIQWHNTAFGIKGSYQVVNDLYTWCSYSTGNITGDARWSSPYFFGRKNTFNMGMTFGF